MAPDAAVRMQDFGVLEAFAPVAVAGHEPV